MSQRNATCGRKQDRLRGIGPCSVSVDLLNCEFVPMFFQELNVLRECCRFWCFFAVQLPNLAINAAECNPMLLLGSRWLPFGSLWLLFDVLWLPFGSPWLPFPLLFDSFLAPFWQTHLCPQKDTAPEAPHQNWTSAPPKLDMPFFALGVLSGVPLGCLEGGFGVPWSPFSIKLTA